MACSRMAPLVLVVLALMAGSALAARSNPWREIAQDEKRRAQVRGRGEYEQDWRDWKGYVATRYLVPPQMHDDFVDEWKRFEKDVLKEDGIIIFDLSKSSLDNIYFWSYGEWEHIQDWWDHGESDHVADWNAWLAERDILVDLWPLRNVTDDSQEQREDRESFRRSSGKGGDAEDNKRRYRKNAAHVVFSYHVNPSDVNEFIDVWQDVAETTWGEEDANKVYSLRKIGTKNHHFIGYGSWDNYRDFLEHLHSDHMGRLREFAANRQIVWRIDPVFKLGDMPEGERDMF